MTNNRDLLENAAQRAIRYIEKASTRHIEPSPTAIESLTEFAIPLPDQGWDSTEVLAELDRRGSPATVVSTSPRFFGFVAGGVLPVTVAAQWLATAWDQIPNMRVLSPIGCKLEDVAGRWLLELFGFPDDTHCSFVTGTTAADITALLGARHVVLERHGWDVHKQGMFDAPPIRAVVGDGVHTTILRALRVIGVGEDQIIRVPADEQGRMRADKLPALDDGPTIVCVQAGHVSSGAFDPFSEICPKARESGAWCHVDGAFGLWAAATSSHRHLVDGIELADSWACDAHKWLNVPYDSGLCFFRYKESVRQALALQASYLIQDTYDPMDFTLEASRRARGIEVWAALLSLGRNGINEMMERSCRLAEYFAESLTRRGFTIENEVVLNQVLVSFENDQVTETLLAELRREGTAWFSGARWHGRAVMRISVCNWATQKSDIDQCLDLIEHAHNRIVVQA